MSDDHDNTGLKSGFKKMDTKVLDFQMKSLQFSIVLEVRISIRHEVFGYIVSNLIRTLLRRG